MYLSINYVAILNKYNNEEKYSFKFIRLLKCLIVAASIGERLF